jgi:hypothetical protein
MSRGVIHTHAGDDSDGQIWGVEGVNILFLLAGALLGIGLTLMLACHHAPAPGIGAGTIPFLIMAAYVFTLRQGKPKSFDTDLLETLASGTGWMPPGRQPRNPLSSDASA